MKFVRGAVSLTILFALFSLYFIINTPSVEYLAENLFEAIYDSADQGSQNIMISALEKNCQSLLFTNGGLAEFLEKCKDENSTLNMKISCENYEISKELGFGDIAQFEEICPGLLSGKFENTCKFLRELEEVNITSISTTCQDYKENRIDRKSLFVLTMMKSIPQNFEEQFSDSFILRLNNFFNVIFLVLLIPALVFLYYLSNDIKTFLKELGKIFITFGTILLVIYLILKLILFFGFDTNEILVSLTRWESLDAETQRNLVVRLLPIIWDSLFGTLYSLALALVALIIGFEIKWHSDRK